MKTGPKSLSKRSLIGTLIFATTLAMTLPPQGWAMLVPAEIPQVSASAASSRAADLKSIQTALESKVIRQRLQEFKLSPEKIDERLGQLSDAQIHDVATQIRSVNPGGDAGLGILVTLLVIGILVLLFVYLFKRV